MNVTQFQRGTYCLALLFSFLVVVNWLKDAVFGIVSSSYIGWKVFEVLNSFHIIFKSVQRVAHWIKIEMDY